jgi:DNA-binding MarR family transcriptional regulator
MKRQTGVVTWLRLTRTHQKIHHAATAQVRPFGLTLAQFDVLAHVSAAEGLPQQDLADALLVTKGNVCQLVDRLEERGLIARRQDGRVNRLYLTEAGRALVAEVIPAHEAAIAERFAALPRSDQVKLHALLRRLDRALAPAQGTEIGSPSRSAER